MTKSVVANSDIVGSMTVVLAVTGSVLIDSTDSIASVTRI